MNLTSILIVTPDDDILAELAEFVKEFEASLLVATRAAEAMTLLEDQQPNLILLDEDVKDLTPEDLLKQIQVRELDTFLIIFSHQPDLNRAALLMAEGVFAYLPAPVDTGLLSTVIRKGLENQGAYNEVVEMAEDLKAANADLEKEKAALKEKTEDLRFLYDLAAELSKTLNPLEMVAVAARSLRRLLEADLTVFLTVFNPAKGHRIYVNRPLADGLARSLAEELIAEAALEPPLNNLEVYPPEKGGSTLLRRPKHRVAIPLTAAGHQYGVMGVYSSHRLHINADRWLLLDSLGLQTAQALFNAHMHEAALEQADHDPLTGLYNRRAFNRRITNEFERVLRYGASLSLIILDLDRFKSVNDVHGHKAGDEVLVAVARIIEECVRATDLVARFGGEEFAVILPETGQEKALILAHRIRARLNRSDLAVGGIRIKQTISQGLADASNENIGDPDDLIRAADKALYLAKREGRDTIRTADEIAIAEPRKEEAYACQ